MYRHYTVHVFQEFARCSQIHNEESSVSSAHDERLANRAGAELVAGELQALDHLVSPPDDMQTRANLATMQEDIE